MTKPIIVVKICYKLLYCMYVIQVVKKIFIFGHTYLFAMLLASHIFYTQGVFI